MNKSELTAILIKNPTLKLYHDDCEWGVSAASFHLSKVIKDFKIVKGELFDYPQSVDYPQLSTFCKGDIEALEKECETDLQKQIDTGYAEYVNSISFTVFPTSREEYTKIKTEQRAARQETLRRCNEVDWSITFGGS